MIESVRQFLLSSPLVAFGLVFGSHARGTARPDSDVDVAIGVAGRARLDAHDLGDLTSRIEQATGRDVDLVVLHEAGIPLAFRVFREGIEVLVRDRAAFVDLKARTIVEWFDFQHTCEICVAGALRAARRG